MPRSGPLHRDGALFASESWANGRTGLAKPVGTGFACGASVLFANE